MKPLRLIKRLSGIGVFAMIGGIWLCGFGHALAVDQVNADRYLDAIVFLFLSMVGLIVIWGACWVWESF